MFYTQKRRPLQEQDGWVGGWGHLVLLVHWLAGCMGWLAGWLTTLQVLKYIKTVNILTSTYRSRRRMCSSGSQTQPTRTPTVQKQQCNSSYFFFFLLLLVEFRVFSCIWLCQYRHIGGRNRHRKSDRPTAHPPPVTNRLLQEVDPMRSSSSSSSSSSSCSSSAHF